MESICQDLRYGLRSLRRTPGFTVSAVVTLALGIGANSAIVSVMDAVLLKTVPVSDPGRLYFLGHGAGANPGLSSTYPLFERYRRVDDVFAGVTAYNVQEFKVSTAAGPQLVTGQYVTNAYHDVLGVGFIRGRVALAQAGRSATGFHQPCVAQTFRHLSVAPDPRLDVSPALKENSGGATTSRHRLAAGQLLAICQIALCVLLLAGTGPLVRSLHNLKAMNAGFQKSDVLLFYVDTRGTTSQVFDVYGRLLDKLRAVPGVQAVSFSTASPLATDSEERGLLLPGVPASEQARSVVTNRVTADYFTALGIAVLRGARSDRSRLGEDSSRSGRRRDVRAHALRKRRRARSYLHV